MKLRSLVKEDWYTDKKQQEQAADMEPEVPQMSVQDKKKFVEMVKGFNEYGGKIYNEHNLVDIAKNLSRIAEMAEAVTMNSVDESFDKVTVQRNIKELKQLAGQFSKAATEGQALKLRMTGLYEDMGGILGRYFDIQEGTLNVKGPNDPDDALKTAVALNKPVNNVDPKDPDVQKYLDDKSKITKKYSN